MADVFPTGDKFDVFISYRRKDSAALAKLIENQLERYDINVFLDVTDIQETGDFSDHLQMAIETADFFVCLLGAETLDSQWVLNEIEYACQHNKILIPVLQESFVQSDNYPPSVQLLLKQQGVNVLDKRGLYIEQAIESLAKLIKPQAVSSPARAVPVQGHGVVHSRNRERMLQSVRNYWIDGVLENSLHGAALIELGLEQSAEKVANPWDTILRIHEDDERSLRSDESIVDVFTKTQGKLLVLGEPGGGKTTTMLHLTRVLLEWSEKDPAQPIPAVFNLSSWAEKRRSLAEWLIDELNEKYNAPRKVAQQWIEDDALLLLLDGLDEVELSARNACVEAINAFRQEHGFVDMVVCSRSQDYAALSKKLQLAGAVVIQPLADHQVDAYLSGLGAAMDTLRQLLNEDSHMKTLAQTPLMLSIMALAFQHVNIRDVKHYETLEEQRSYIFDLYIARMFKRRGDAQHYSPELTQHYLEWLAREQSQHQQTLFHIEDLQETYLPDNWQRAAYRFLHRTLAGLGVGALIGLLSGLLFTFGAWLFPPISIWSTYWEINALLTVIFTLWGMLIGSTIGAALFIPAAILDAALIQAQFKPRNLYRFLATSFILTLMGALVGFVISITGTTVITAFNSYNITSLQDLIDYFIDYFIRQRISLLIVFTAGLAAYCSIYAFVFGRVRRLQRWMHYSLAYGLGNIIFWIVAVLASGGSLALLLQGLVVSVVLMVGAAVLSLYGDRVTSAERLGWSWSWRWMTVLLLLLIVLIIPAEVIRHGTIFTDYLNLNSSPLLQKLYPNYFDASGSLQNWHLAVDVTKSVVVENDLPVILLVLLSAIMGGGVIGGLSKQESIEQRTKPNQGIRRSVLAALKTAAGFGLAGSIISGIAVISFYFTSSPTNIAYINLNLAIAVATMVGLMVGMTLGLLFAGTDTVIKHSLLRWMLWGNGVIPWNYNRFLGYAADRIFLRRVGGGFIYVHRYLLEHFARRNTSPAWLKKQVKRRRLPAITVFALVLVIYPVVALLSYGSLNLAQQLFARLHENESEPLPFEPDAPLDEREMEIGVRQYVQSGNRNLYYTINEAGTWLAIEVFPDNSTVDIGNLTLSSTSLETDQNLLDEFLSRYDSDHYYEVLIREAGRYRISVIVNSDYDTGYGIVVNLLPVDSLALGNNDGQGCRRDCRSRFEVQAGDFMLLQYDSPINSDMQILDPSFNELDITPSIYNGTGRCEAYGTGYIRDMQGGTILPFRVSGTHYALLRQSDGLPMRYDNLVLQQIDPIEAQVGDNPGSISVTLPVQVWRYEGATGESLTLNTTADWDTQLSLFGPDYNSVQHNDDAGEEMSIPLCTLFQDWFYEYDIPVVGTLTSRIETTLAESGSYYIVVSSFENMTHGDYILTIDSSQRRGTQSR